jgi:hypothetical protein
VPGHFWTVHWKSNRARLAFETFIFPALGSRPIRCITAPQLLTVLREARGTHEAAHRVRAACSGLFRYAIATGRDRRR